MARPLCPARAHPARDRSRQSLPDEPPAGSVAAGAVHPGRARTRSEIHSRGQRASPFGRTVRPTGVVRGSTGRQGGSCRGLLNPRLSGLISLRTAVANASLRPHLRSPFPMPACVTKEAPAFTGDAVVNEEFKTVKLADHRGKYVVLF